MRRRFKRAFSCGFLGWILVMVTCVHLFDPLVYAQESYQEAFTKDETQETILVEDETQSEMQTELEVRETEMNKVGKQYATVAMARGCTVLVNGDDHETQAAPGEMVTVTVNAEVFKTIQLLAVVDTCDQRVQLQPKDQATYTFCMPEDDVQIYAVAEYNTLGVSMMAASSAKVTRSDFSHDDYTSNPNGSTIHAEYLELDGQMAICTQHMATAPAVGAVYSLRDTYTAANKKNESMRKAMYYGYGGPGDLNIATYQVTHVAVSVANGYPDSSWALGAKFLSTLASYPAAPDGFNVYIYSASSGTQELAIWDYNPKSYIQIQKTFSGGSLDNYDPNKSTAIYDIYTDAACTKLYHTPYMTANTGRYRIEKNGKSAVLTVEPGTYYVKEEVAPLYYDLDPKVYTVKATAGNTSATPVMVNSTDVFNDKRYIQIEKSFGGSLTKYDPDKSTAIYGIFTDAACTTLYHTPYMTANSGRYRIEKDGKSAVLTVEAGTYYIKEVVAPADFTMDPKIYTVTATAKNTYATPVMVHSVDDYRPIRYLQIEKTFEGGGLTTYDPDKSTAIYGIFTDAACTTLYHTPFMTANTGRYRIEKDGKSARLSVEPGIYYIKEVVAPAGYKLDSQVYRADTTNATTVALTVVVHSTDKKEPDGSSVSIKKKTTMPALVQNNSCYSLSGAVYGIYSSRQLAASGGTGLGTLTTDAYGESTSFSGNPGTYYVKEISAPKGYQLDSTIYEITLQAGESKVLEVEDVPYYQMQLELEKMAADAAGAKPYFSLQGARFRIDYYDGYYNESQLAAKSVKQSWQLVTDASGRASLNQTLPLGTYLITETQAPDGYVLSGACYKNASGQVLSRGTTYCMQVTEASAAKSIKVGNIRVEDRYFYGEFDFKKCHAGDGMPMGNIPFKLTSAVTGKNYTLYTGADGTYSSQKDDTLPPLVSGKYTLEELSCTANANMLLQTVTFTIDGYQTTVHLGTIYNEDLYTETAYIRTTARVQETGAQIVQAKSGVTLVDRVRYAGLQAGKRYHLVTWVMDARTGGYVKDNGGHAVTTEKEFVPTSSDGYIETSIDIDARNYSGQDVVMFEELYADGALVCVHKDLKDQGQTIHFPEIHTTAKDADTGTHEASDQETIKITDRVQYANLIPGKAYTVHGILMNQSTGKPVLDEHLREIKSERTFVAEQSQGSIDVMFEVKTSDLKGKTLVVFEELYYDSILIAVHSELSDQNQSIHVPEAPKETEKETETEEKPELPMAPNTGEPQMILLIFMLLTLLSGGAIAAYLWAWYNQKKKI